MYKKTNSKKSFFLLELIFVILLLSLFSYILIPKNPKPEFDTAVDRLVLYLNETRLQALIDDKYSLSNPLWHKKRWTMKFFRCRESTGGIYYSIYSDENMTGQVNASESLKDPLSKKNIYSSNSCQENSSNSEYVLLTKKFGIENVAISCNNTESLGQISFGNNGNVYTKLSNIDNDSYSYLLENDCILEFKAKNSDTKRIKIYAKTGFIEKL